ncbi:galactosylgalactosylxylosylprotein 3-beta-glucuronosyltransferase S isoform X1 [Drosophila sulfurigaster albostrigata]|uniref:galactosylgalactosylxylosylprotein 3-beta-glucuronosyltransferase S isoform X1 n=1 Tax=Drosophila sulfurigaster albostrigata TaxID=89887 RepID=UPI002D21E6E2|nr:galactosylgalactosylxylosylprotein 3-beta-glucuronosyltransferase S isoform X1 [Drosophila sulfurigaster albostrigata]
MPSAHYFPLELRASDDDQDCEEQEQLVDTDHRSSMLSNQYNLHYHPQLADYDNNNRTPELGMGMAPRLSRPGPSRRRYWLPILIIASFCVIFYLMFSSQALGLGGSFNDGDDDFEPHSGQGKRWVPFPYQVSEFKFLTNKPKNENQNSSSSHALNESLHICSESHEDRRLYMQDKPHSAYAQLPVIYFVTPTYPRREQIPELTRLAHTLLHVPRIHWLVANDYERCDTYMDMLLNRIGIPFTHLSSPMPHKFRSTKPAPRGVANRRAALQWIRQHNLTNGVLYFGDDDNTYDLRLFSEIRQTQRVSMFPVGLIADYAVSGPVVRDGKVVAFLDSWVAGRRWPVDMAGFAVNLAYMSLYPNVNMPYKPGYEEDLFLRSIGLHIDQIEPRGMNCTEVLVWHTQTKSKKAPIVRLEKKFLDGRSNLGALFRSLKAMGVASVSDTEGPLATISKNGKGKAHSYFLS